MKAFIILSLAVAVLAAPQFNQNRQRQNEDDDDQQQQHSFGQKNNNQEQRFQTVNKFIKNQHQQGEDESSVEDHTEQADARSQNVVDAAEAQGHTTFAQVVRDNGLYDALSKAGSEFTVFAPTNEAFDEIQSTIATLSADQLVNVLKRHVVKDYRLTQEELYDGRRVYAMNDEVLEFSNPEDSSFWYVETEAGNKVELSFPEIDATNGVVHGVQHVLL